MATPAMQKQTFFAKVYFNDPLDIRIDTFNADGSVLDVHTGYTLASVSAQPSADANKEGGGFLDVTSKFSATFDATGFNLHATMANAGWLTGNLAVINNDLAVAISNDGGTTKAIAAIGQLVVAQIY